jgi:hypothetical protein
MLPDQVRCLTCPWIIGVVNHLLQREAPSRSTNISPSDGWFEKGFKDPKKSKADKTAPTRSMRVDEERRGPSHLPLPLHFHPWTQPTRKQAQFKIDASQLQTRCWQLLQQHHADQPPVLYLPNNRVAALAFATSVNLSNDVIIGPRNPFTPFHVQDLPHWRCPATQNQDVTRRRAKKHLKTTRGLQVTLPRVPFFAFLYRSGRGKQACTIPNQAADRLLSESQEMSGCERETHHRDRHPNLHRNAMKDVVEVIHKKASPVTVQPHKSDGRSKMQNRSTKGGCAPAA